MFRNPMRRNPTNTSSTGTNHGNGNDASTSAKTLQDSEYARRCRDIMKMYHALRALGAERFLEDNLPKIVVIGAQSAGKSSLVEAVSKITVPRDSGTCTRCPMECTMSSDAATWSCTITLRKEFHADGSPRDVFQTEPFVTITRKDEVELYLRRAQAAILSSNKPSGFFLTKSVKELNDFLGEDGTVSFSRNTIEVNLRSPDVTDLAFVDLPGLLYNADDTDKKMVEKLVKSKIRSDKTIVLVTIPMHNDMQLAEAFKMAQVADPDGNRTIAVLTKPDSLQTGDSGLRESWRRILLGKEYPLKHGYFCVRLPDDEQRRRKESVDTMARTFFELNSPWNELPDRTRLGIKGLVDYLSRLLVNMVDENIPHMKSQVAALIASDTTRLQLLGSAPVLSNAIKDIHMRIIAFGSDLQNTVDGAGVGHKAMVQCNRLLFTTLTQDILKTCPNFQPHFNGDCEGVDPVCLTSPSLEDDTFKYLKQSLQILFVDDVRAVITRNNTWELPGEVSPDALRDLIFGFTCKWSQHALDCFANVLDNTSFHVGALVKQHFGQYKTLEVHMRSIVIAEIQKNKNEALVILKKAIQLETIRVYTGMPEFLQQRDRWLQRYTQVYTSHYMCRPVPAVPSEELQLMAKVRAYFEVAYKRFIDNVPLTIENEIHQHLALRLTEALVAGMGGIRAEELMKEDPDVAKERFLLIDRLKRLREIQHQLDILKV